LESARSFLLEVSGELLETFKFDETLDSEPGGLRKPFLKRRRSRSIHSEGAVNQEVHLSLVVLTFKETLLHKSERE